MPDRPSPANEIEAELERTRQASIAELEKEIEELMQQISAEDPREAEYRRMVQEANSLRKLIDESLNTQRKSQMVQELNRKKEKLQLLRDNTRVIVRTPQASSGGC